MTLRNDAIRTVLCELAEKGTEEMSYHDLSEQVRKILAKHRPSGWSTNALRMRSCVAELERGGRIRVHRCRVHVDANHLVTVVRLEKS